MDHIDAMLKGDADNVILGEISRNGSEAFSNLIRFIGLSGRTNSVDSSALSPHQCCTHLLTMGGQPILVRIDGDCVHRELMGRTEDSDRDFLGKRGFVSAQRVGSL